MKIRFTKQSYRSKEQALASFGCQEWLEADGGFGLLVDLYRAGHIICVTDLKFTDTVILDLDALEGEQVTHVHDDSYLEQLRTQLGAEEIVRLDSASRVPYKQKLFVHVRLERDLSTGGKKDRAYVRFREKFEQLSGLVCDPRMDRPAQVTFGVAAARPMELPAGAPSVQPANRDFAKAGSEEPKKKSQNKGSRKELTISTGPSEFRWVPLNMLAYNRAYGRSRREGGRFEWQTRHFDPSSGHWVKSEIRRGSRHVSRARLIAAAVYNALYQNANYNTDFTLDDVQHTVWKTIQYQFEGAEQFLAEEGTETISCIAGEWAFAQSTPLESYYCHLVSAAKAKEQRLYVPRDLAAKRLYVLNEARFAQCASLAEARELAGEIALGEVDTVNKLLYHYKKAGYALHNAKGHFGNYAELLASAPRSPEGLPIVDPRYKHNTPFRRYLREHGGIKVAFAKK